MPSPDNLFEFMRDIEGNIAFKKFSIKQEIWNIYAKNVYI